MPALADGCRVCCRSTFQRHKSGTRSHYCAETSAPAPATSFVYPRGQRVEWVMRRRDMLTQRAGQWWTWRLLGRSCHMPTRLLVCGWMQPSGHAALKCTVQHWQWDRRHSDQHVGTCMHATTTPNVAMLIKTCIFVWLYQGICFSVPQNVSGCNGLECAGMWGTWYLQDCIWDVRV
jgi:hypothetical protein